MPKCCEIKAGDLNRRVTFNELDTVDDGQGGFTQTYTERLKTWAKMKQVSAGEAFRRHRLESDEVWDFTIRYNAATKEIQYTDQIVYNGEEYNVRKINNLEQKNIWIVVTAEKGVPQG